MSVNGCVHMGVQVLMGGGNVVLLGMFMLVGERKVWGLKTWGVCGKALMALFPGMTAGRQLERYCVCVNSHSDWVFIELLWIF